MDGIFPNWPVARVVGLGPTSATQVHTELVGRGDGPVPLLYRPSPTDDPKRALHRLLDALADAAVDVYPAWPPGAAQLEEDANAVAIVLVAREQAEAAEGYAPLWAHAARRARRGASPRGGFPLEVEGRELPRLLELAWQREGLVLFVELGAETDSHDALASALEWIAFHGRIAVAVGPTTPHSVWSRFPTVAVPTLDEPPPTPSTAPLQAPAPPGRPHPHSAVERLVYAALMGLPWAADVRFTQSIPIGAFGQIAIVDILFADACIVVELDGPEHRSAHKYLQDRRRDNELTAQGYVVHRFTNDEILSDLPDVLARLERYVAARRHSNGG